MKKSVILSIGGTDPSGSAGIVADLCALRASHATGVLAVSVVTAQNEDGILSVHPTPSDVFDQQLATACRDRTIDAIKIGMVGTTANINILVTYLKRLQHAHIVIDPVLHSSAGAALMETNAYPIYRQMLLPYAHVITPNIMEAGALSGMQVTSIDMMKKSAAIIYRETVRLKTSQDRRFAVLVKGGHLSGDAVDVLYDGQEYHEFSQLRIDSRPPRGTGCRFATLMALYLSQKKSLVDAVKQAKKDLSDFIQHYHRLT